MLLLLPFYFRAIALLAIDVMRRVGGKCEMPWWRWRWRVVLPVLLFLLGAHVHVPEYREYRGTSVTSEVRLR
jgi:hypothetical protein